MIVRSLLLLIFSRIIHQSYAYKNVKFSKLSSHFPVSIFRNNAVIDETIISVAAGSFSGAIGMGVAYPLDSLKTKIQILTGKSDAASNIGKISTLEILKRIFKDEGIHGFYNGVGSVMFGQALSKAFAFGANSFALVELANLRHTAEVTNIYDVGLAAAFAGFVTSFLTNPFERLKILQQANQAYSSTSECLKEVLRKDGLNGLVFRGIDSTIARDTPGYMCYFMIYTIMMSQTQISDTFGMTSPLICGALAGMLSKIPVYPFDVIKTNMQNTIGNDGANGKNMLHSAKVLYERSGIMGFFEGITPKLFRAAVLHSVTFYMYETLMSSYRVAVHNV